jgi:cytochrome c oxidase assembly protein subunit 15
MTGVPSQNVSAWPHRLAVLLVCATFPLIWVGGLVTTYEAGMAVPDWPNTYGYNLFLYPWQTWLLGPWDLFIEHGHRLLGALVGLLTIALAVVLWLKDERRWLRWLGLLAIVAVVGQGLLGGLRVLLDERLLAKIHGCFGPAFFGLCVALAVFTSRLWRESPPPRLDLRAGKLQRMTLLTTFLAYAQIVLGAQLRHISIGLEAGAFRVLVLFHLFMAAMLTLHVALLAALVLRAFRDQPALVRPALALLVLIGVQLALGVGTWVFNYGWPNWLGDYAWGQRLLVVQESQRQTLTTTAHVAGGSLVLVTSLVVSLRSLRLFRAGSSAQQWSTQAAGVAV